jgi:hypothetical protein
MLLPSGTNTALTTKSVWPFRVASGYRRGPTVALCSQRQSGRGRRPRERRGRPYCRGPAVRTVLAGCDFLTATF